VRLSPAREEIADRETEMTLADGLGRTRSPADTPALDAWVDVDAHREPAPAAVTRRVGGLAPSSPGLADAAPEAADPGEVGEILDPTPAAALIRPVPDFGSLAPVDRELVDVAQLAELRQSMRDYADRAQAHNTTRA
jgi:hypothetical protein